MSRIILVLYNVQKIKQFYSKCYITLFWQWKCTIQQQCLTHSFLLCTWWLCDLNYTFNICEILQYQLVIKYGIQNTYKYLHAIASDEGSTKTKWTNSDVKHTKISALMYLTNRWCHHLFLITPAEPLDIHPWTLCELSKSQSVVIKWCCGIPVTEFSMM